MAGPDTSNAHVRGDEPKRKQKRQSQASIDAEKLLNDPAFQNAMQQVETGIVMLIAETQHDGSPESDAAEREMCRTLRTLRCVPRVMRRILQGEQLRLADFRAHDREAGSE